MRKALLATCLVSVVLPLTTAAATVYDGFNYPSGSSLAGQNGGFGWNGSWNNSATLLDVKIGSGLNYAGLATSPGSATSDPAASGQVAFFSRPLGATYGTDNTTLYLSVLLRPDAGFGFYGGVNLEGLFIGKSGPTNTYGIEGPTNDISSSSVTAVAGTTVLLVLRADFLPGNDRFSLFVNPTVGGPEPAVPDALKTNVDLSAVNFIFVNNAGAWTTDEIRLGTTFSSVAGVPEPCSMSMAFVGIAAVAVLMRRRR